MQYKNCVIIAEVGVNHNGSLAMALDLVRAAAATGADFVKLQIFQANKVAIPEAPKADYQNKNLKRQDADSLSQLQMLEKLQLGREDYLVIAEAVKALPIQLLATPFDFESLQLMMDLGIESIKIPSGEITNGPFLLRIAQTGKPVILSTGLSNLEEIREALAVLAFGYLYPEQTPTALEQCLQVFATAEAQKKLQKNVQLLHCVSEYPAPYEEVNLRAMKTMAETFGLPVGYSDHTLGTIAAVGAVACGATIIEKHFTLDTTLPGPDHSASLDPVEFKSMVTQIRLMEKILGSDRKEAGHAEEKNKKIIRRGLYTTQTLSAGQTLNEQNVVVLRPAGDLSPMQWWELVGTKTKKSYTRFEEL